MGKIWSSGSTINKSAVAEGPTRATPNLSNPLQKVREVEARLQHLRQSESLGHGMSLPPQRLVAPRVGQSLPPAAPRALVTSLAPHPVGAPRRERDGGGSLGPPPPVSKDVARAAGAGSGRHPVALTVARDALDAGMGGASLAPLAGQRPASQPPVRVRRLRLGEVLLQRGMISQAQLDAALCEQQRTGARIGSVLVELGFVRAEDMVSALAEQLGVEVILQNDIEIDPSARDVLPLDMIKRHEVVPLFANPKVLRIAMADPTNLAVIDELRFTSGRWIQVVLTPEATVRALIASSFSTDTLLAEALQGGAGLGAGETLETLKVEEAEEEARDTYDLVQQSADQPVVNFVNFLLLESVRRRASDIHIEPYENSLRVRFRVDGELVNIVSPPRRLHTPVVSRIKVMSGMDISKRRIPQDGHLAVRERGQVLHYRVSTLPTVFGEKCVMRLLTKDAALAELPKLGMEDDAMRRFRRAIGVPQGLVLVTGPTGSGKTTTVHAALNAIAKPSMNVMTLEDPVEVTLPGINHVQVRESLGVSFADGLRSLLRQDPDVIFVGEMRDAEVSRIAIRASLTGHLVLTTLHTNSALESFERLDDMGIERYLIAATVQTVVAQRLLRRVCSGCAEPITMAQLRQPIEGQVELVPEVLAALAAVTLPETPTLMLGKGCDRCLRTGYRGRLGAYEVLPIDREMRELLRTQAKTEQLLEAATARGFTTLFEHGLRLCARGLTTPFEVQRVLAPDK